MTKEIDQRAHQPEMREHPFAGFDWSKWQEATVERGEEENAIWVELDYDPDLTPEQKKLFRVKERMPFKIQLRLYDFALQDLDNAFYTSKHNGKLHLTNACNPRAQDKGEVVDRFNQEICKLISSANLSFFWHGWASSGEYWKVWSEIHDNSLSLDGSKDENKLLKANIRKRSTPDRPVVNILPTGLGIEGGCATEKINGQECMTPQHYGEQMANFIDQFFGWDHQIDLFGHSMGGIGVIWAAVQVLESQQFRTTLSEIPDIRIWAFAPAYPAEANIFTDFLTRLGVNIAAALPQGLKQKTETLVRLISTILIKKRIQRSPGPALAHHADIITRVTDVVQATMRGLMNQNELSAQQWADILNHFPVVIITSPQDLVVDEDISQNAFRDLTLAAQQYCSSDRTPLTFSEFYFIGKGDHAVRSLRMPERREQVGLTKLIAPLPYPTEALSAIFDEIPAAQLPEFVAFLAQEYQEMRMISDAQRPPLIEKILNSLPQPKRKKGRDEILDAIASSYYKLLWRKPFNKEEANLSLSPSEETNGSKQKIEQLIQNLEELVVALRLYLEREKATPAEIRQEIGVDAMDIVKRVAARKISKRRARHGVEDPLERTVFDELAMWLGQEKVDLKNEEINQACRQALKTLIGYLKEHYQTG